MQFYPASPRCRGARAQAGGENRRLAGDTLNIMKDNHTDITIVLDRSGSMQRVADDTIGGFNKFLQDQQAAPGTATITLHQFDDLFETPIKAQDVKSAKPLNRETFSPRGSTALLDAIARGIKHTGSRMESTPEANRAAKVIFVVITDGQENASREFTKNQVNDMITHQREKYSWEFVFLGANQDAIATAASLGVTSANAMTYAHNAVGTTQAFAATSQNLTSLRRGATKSMAYSTQDREAQKLAGA